MNASISRRGMKIIGVTLLIYALLVAPHEGEFWPFSIYPMFSQAGNPWTRAMVLDVSSKADADLWETQLLQNRESDVVPVGKYGVDQIDFSNFVVKTQNWTDSRRQALIEMFGSNSISGERWMVSKVRGELIGRDSVAIKITPFILLTADSTYLNPILPETAYGGMN
ncbi:hypothetical protein [Rhodohalobacter sp. 8-1]|uniref:hypothetical protein n=1 Tax=Rhodohalobacter sp. 8-1 TaxID=3131972 RepID=UPI0030ED4C7D